MWSGKKLICATLLASAYLTTATLAQTQVCLREAASVGAATILLGDVAEVQAGSVARQQSFAALPLGWAPAGDAERVLTRAQVKHALERSGLDLTDVQFQGAEEVRVKAALQLLDPQRVAQSIRQQLAAEYPGDLFKLRVLKVTLNGQVLAPAGEFTLRPVMIPSSGRPADALTIDIYSSERRIRRFQAQVEWEWEASVAVAARNLPFGHVVSDGDVNWISQKRQDLPAGLVLDSASLTGMRLRRPLQAGESITRAVLAQPKVVEKGDWVQLVLRARGFSIVTTGVAQQAGESGDKIKVIQANSKKLFVGKVVGKNKVEIGL